MALHDDKTRIRAALVAIPGVKRVLPAWPEDWQQIPTIVISEAGNMPADNRDDLEYVTELEYYIRVFAARASEIADIASAADDAMVGLGYERTISWEDDSAAVHQKVMRYRLYL